MKNIKVSTLKSLLQSITKDTSKREIATRTQLSYHSLFHQLVNLEERGYVTKRKITKGKSGTRNHKETRSHYFNLTPKGKKLLELI